MDLLNLVWVMFICRGINSLKTESVKECFKYVSGKYFKDQMILLLVPSEEKGEAQDWLYEIIEYVIGSGEWSVHLSSENYLPSSSQDFRLKLDRQRARNIVILIREESEDANSKITKLAENWLWHSSARIMVVFVSEGTGEAVLKNLWNTKRALNVIVMAIGKESISFSTMYPFPNLNDVVTLNEWKDGFQEEREMYVNKIPTNFEGHLLKVGIFYNEPYILQPNVSGNYEDGTEIRIVKALRSNLNFEMEFMEAPPGENPYIAMVNGTPYGLFGLIYRGNADLMLLGIKNRFDRHIMSDALTPHTFDRSVWIVPSSYSEKGSFYDVFEVEVWIATGLTFVLLTCTVILLSRFNWGSATSPVLSISDCIILAFSSHLNYPTEVKNQRTRMKVLMVVMYLYALHITSAYDSNLFQIFTGRTVKKFFDSPNEAVDAGLVAYLFPSARPAYNQSNHEMWNKILKQSGHVYTNDYARSLSIISENKTVFTLMLENVAKYEIAKRKDPNQQMIHIIDKAFSSYPATIFMSRGHPLTELFDRKIQQLVEGGIVRHWLKEFLHGSHQLKGAESHFEGEEPLKLKHFHAVLYMVFGGWILAAFAFFSEVFIAKVAYQK